MIPSAGLRGVEGAGNAAGFTLMEVLIGLVLLIGMLMASWLIYRSAITLHAGFLTQHPVAQAASNMATLMAEHARASDCILRPPAPSASPTQGNLLLGMIGRDCSNPPEINQPGALYFAFCLGPENMILFSRGAASTVADAVPPGILNCDLKAAAFKWRILTPISVTAGPGSPGGSLFVRTPKLKNAVKAQILFKQPAPLNLDPGLVLGTSNYWQSTFTFRAALDAP